MRWEQLQPSSGGTEEQQQGRLLDSLVVSTLPMRLTATTWPSGCSAHATPSHEHDAPVAFAARAQSASTPHGSSATALKASSAAASSSGHGSGSHASIPASKKRAKWRRRPPISNRNPRISWAKNSTQNSKQELLLTKNKKRQGIFRRESSLSDRYRGRRSGDHLCPWRWGR